MPLQIVRKTMVYKLMCHFTVVNQRAEVTLHLITVAGNKEIFAWSRKRLSMSSQGADTSGMPQASASKGQADRGNAGERRHIRAAWDVNCHPGNAQRPAEPQSWEANQHRRRLLVLARPGHRQGSGRRKRATPGRGSLQAQEETPVAQRSARRRPNCLSKQDRPPRRGPSIGLKTRVSAASCQVHACWVQPSLRYRSRMTRPKASTPS